MYCIDSPGVPEGHETSTFFAGFKSLSQETLNDPLLLKYPKYKIGRALSLACKFGIRNHARGWDARSFSSFILSKSANNHDLNVRFWQTRYVTPLFRTFCVQRCVSSPKIGPKVGTKYITDRKGERDFYWNWATIIEISIYHKNKTPRPLCDLYEHHKCIFHPEGSM